MKVVASTTQKNPNSTKVVFISGLQLRTLYLENLFLLYLINMNCCKVFQMKFNPCLPRKNKVYDFFEVVQMFML